MSDPDRRIFEYFADNIDTAQEVDYLAFAAYAFAKFEWYDKFKSQNGADPDQNEVNKWVSELPDSRLDEIHQTAGRVFRNAAREYMAEEIKIKIQKAISASIDTEIKRHNKIIEDHLASSTSFKSNVLPNAGYGIISSFIFAVIIILASLIVTKDPSPIALYKQFAPGVSAPTVAGPSPIPAPPAPNSPTR